MSTPTPLSAYYLTEVRKLAPLYFALVQKTIAQQEAPWERFRTAMQRVLSYGDLRSASIIRWNALRQPLRRNNATAVKDLDAIKAANPWYDIHASRTTPAIVQRAAMIAALEQRYWLAKSKGVGMREPTEHVPVADWRLREQFRTALSDTTNSAEQLQLANPNVSRAFPFWVYETREDQRVRPTHAAMDGFIAVNSWEGWRKVRPPAFFNCRCVLTYKTIHYARREGWVDANDKPRFEVRWPNSAARANWESGRFPEFKNNKYVQLGTFGK